MTKKLRIGVYIDDEYQPQIGGISAYHTRLIDRINSFKFDDKIEVFFLSKTALNENVFKKPVLQIPYPEIEANSWTKKLKIIYKIFSFSILNYFNIKQRIKVKIEKNIDINVTKFLSQKEVDLIYYTTTNVNPLNYPFIATHWDIGHKNMFFVDFFSKEKVEKREGKLKIVLQTAFAVFVESEQSKKELIRFENLYEDKIFIVPLFAGKVVELNVDKNTQQNILVKWKLEKDSFYFYPAQFWGHKNHYGLIMAFKLVLNKYPQFKLVLSGTDKGNLDYIKGVVKSAQLENKVVFAGFVSNEEVYSFYKNTIALVMPTLLGPTNMPLLEAYNLGCRVICSNLEGHKHQMKNRAIYFETFNHVEIAQKMIDVLSNAKPEFTKEEDKTGFILNQHFLTLYNIRKTFGY
jgi:glycosyltransferase involved in cell wall biosynthesis